VVCRKTVHDTLPIVSGVGGKTNHRAVNGRRMNLLLVLHFIGTLPRALFGRRESGANCARRAGSGADRSCLGRAWPSWNLEGLFSRCGSMRVGLGRRASGSLWLAVSAGPMWRRSACLAWRSVCLAWRGKCFRWRPAGASWRGGLGKAAQSLSAQGPPADTVRRGGATHLAATWLLTDPPRLGGALARRAANPPRYGNSDSGSPVVRAAGPIWSWPVVASRAGLNCFSRQIIV
jgi:hypothetical protein